MSTKETITEEVDLGQLFKLIGNAINTVYNRVFNTLRNIYHIFIRFILFLRAHFLKFCYVAILGVGLGAYLDYNALPVYKSSMIVQPNFNSARQLYSNIEFYNQLAEQKDSKELAVVLDIPLSLAERITNIGIEAFTDKAQKIQQFNEFIKNLDSITLKSIDFQDYLKNFNNINAEFHKIKVESLAPEVAKQCQEIIVTSINNNPYFKSQKKANDDNMAVRDTMIKEQLKEIKKLQEFYKEIKILDAKKVSGTTNINLADNKEERVSEFELFKQIEKLKDEKVELNIDKVNRENIINIISEFPDKGILIDNLWSKKIVQMPLVFMVVLFSILIILAFNKYLANYR